MFKLRIYKFIVTVQLSTTIITYYLEYGASSRLRDVKDFKRANMAITSKQLFHLSKANRNHNIAYSSLAIY